MVVGGKEASVTPCFMCHGLDGVGDSAGAFPRLTGQAAFYMYKQLIDYASGARPNDVMTPIARGDDRAADGRRRLLLLGGGRALRAAPGVEPEVLERGRKLAEDGRPEADLRPATSATAAAAPAIRRCSPISPASMRPTPSCSCSSGKRACARTTRSTSWPTSPTALSDEDIRAVALYFEWLRPDWATRGWRPGRCPRARPRRRLRTGRMLALGAAAAAGRHRRRLRCGSRARAASG